MKLYYIGYADDDCVNYYSDLAYLRTRESTEHAVKHRWNPGATHIVEYELVEVRRFPIDELSKEEP